MKTIHADFFDFLKAGKISFLPFCVIDGENIFPVSCKKTLWDDGLQLHCEYADGMTDDFYYRDSVCTRKFRNGMAKIKLNELGLTLSGITFGGKTVDDYFYHNENPRIYERMTFPVDYSRTKGDAGELNMDVPEIFQWADIGVVCDRIGRCPYQPFPALHLGNYASKHGIIHGSLAQNPFYHNYLVSHQQNKVTLDIFSSFKSLSYLEVESGEILTDVWYIGATEYAHDLDRLFEGYTKVLRQKLPVNYGATNINRDNLVWGTWNDGIFRDVTEKLVLQEAEYLKKNFPTVRWIQLDDGYAVDVPPAHGLGVPYEGEDGVDHKKFPKGLRHMTDEIRRIGLRPALWIGGLCAHHTKIFKEHPEWFCDYTMRIKDESPLDPSIPEAREYMTHALDVLMTEYGFDGMKHDFWSFAFEESHPLLQRNTKSGYYYRDWWMKELRKRVASDGYLQTGCDIVMGNPFLGQYFTNYRYGIDIGSGNWENVKINFLWGAACFSLHISDIFVPNSDSIGLFPDLNDVDAMFALNYCIASRSMVEIAGKLSENQNHPRLHLLKKAACNVNNGQEVWLLDYDYRKPGFNIPKGLYFKSAFFSSEEENPLMPMRTVGLFNVLDKKMKMSLNAAKLGLDKQKTWLITNIWTHEIFEISPGKSVSFQLEAHGSMLLGIAEKSLVLLDANVKINTVIKKDNSLSLDCAFSVPDAEFLFSEKIKNVSFNGKNIKTEIRENSCKFDLKKAGIYTFEF